MTLAVAQMVASGLRSEARRLWESHAPDDGLEAIGATTSGKRIPNRSDLHYTSPVDGGAHGTMSVHDATRQAGPRTAGALLVVRLHGWSGLDHSEAAARHELMARYADEHHEIFSGEHGDGSELAPGQLKQYRELLSHLKRAADMHRRLAAAHAHASTLR